MNNRAPRQVDKERELPPWGRGSPRPKSFPICSPLAVRVFQAGLRQPHSSRDKREQKMLGGEGGRRDGLQKMGKEGELSCLEGHKFLPRGSYLLPPAVPAALSLSSWLQTPGDTLNLTLLTSQETTNLNWFLWPTGSPSPILLQAGTRVSLTSSRDRAVLSIVNISHKWAHSPPVLPSSSLLPFFFSSFSSAPLHLLLLPLLPSCLFFSSFPLSPFIHSGETKAKRPIDVKNYNERTLKAWSQFQLRTDAGFSSQC